MPSTAEQGHSTRRAFAFKAALRCYPASDRRAMGPELLDAALELSATGNSTAHELGGLVRGGLAARMRRFRLGLLSFDRHAAGAVVVAPLTALVAAVWGTAAVARIAGRTGGEPGVTLGASILLLALALLLIAVARRQRGLATFAALLVLAQGTLSAGWSQWRGDVVTAAPGVHLHVGHWYFGPSLVWSLLPFLVLLVAASWALAPAASRVAGMRRPLRESAILRLAALSAPVAALALIVEYVPTLLLETGGAETTELPGLLFLMMIVSALWLATSTLHGRDHLSAAGALIGLAAVPSVAYGFAHFVTPELDGLAGSQPLRLSVVLGLAAVLMLVAVAIFVTALSRVGLRSVDRAGETA